MYTDPTGEFVDTILAAGFLAYDVYRIFADNVLGKKDNQGENVAALGADVGGFFVPVGTGFGLAVRASKGAEAVAKARALGLAGEKAAGIVKNTRRIGSPTGKARYRIPDQLLRSSRILTEVKNVGELSYTSQLRDYALWVQEHGYQFELTVRKETNLSEPLQAAVDRGDIVLKRLLP